MQKMCCYADTHNADIWTQRCGTSTQPLQSAVGGDSYRWKISIVLHVVLLKLGQDVLAVRVLAEHCDMWTDLVDEQFALWWVGNVDHTLHDVVSKLVLHHCVQCRLRPRTNAHKTSDLQ